MVSSIDLRRRLGHNWKIFLVDITSTRGLRRSDCTNTHWTNLRGIFNGYANSREMMKGKWYVLASCVDSGGIHGLVLVSRPGKDANFHAQSFLSDAARILVHQLAA